MKASMLAIGLIACAAGAFAQSTPVGLWKTIDDETKSEKSLVRIGEQGGALSGKVEKLLDPTKQDARCEACSGSLKNAPVLGMGILSGVHQNAEDKGLWDGGQILDPNNGKSYKVLLRPIEGGKKLEVRGYIGMPLLGRTQTWIRVE